MEKIKLSRKIRLEFSMTKMLLATTKTSATTNLLFLAAKRKLIERPFMGSPRQRYCSPRRRKSCLKYQSQRRCGLPRRRGSPWRRLLFTTTNRKLFEIPISTKMRFTEAKRFTMAKTAIHCNEERTCVSILVLSQTRLLSHNFPACKFFPNT